MNKEQKLISLVSNMDNLSTFHLYRYRFILRPLDQIVLPEYKGFALRGVFGGALKRVVCAIKRSDCNDCILQGRCVYAYIFETRPTDATPDARKFSDHPRPYLISPPLGAKRSFSPGEELAFEMTLVGRANDYLPYFVYTFEEIGREGFRRGKGRFAVDRVESLDIVGNSRVIYRNGSLSPVTARIDFVSLESGTDAADSVRLSFLTPARIEVKGNLSGDAPPFRLLVEMLMRRAVLLNCLHCGGEYGDISPELLREAEGVEIERSSVRWRELERYSNRQKTKILQGGIMGEITYRGEIAHFLPLLRLGELINVGKSTVFGLGKYILTSG